MSQQMTFTFEGFVAWMAKIKQRAKQPQLEDTMAFVGTKSAESVDRSFRFSRSPEGIIFKPVKRTDSGGPPLVLTGDMRKMALGSAKSVMLAGNIYFSIMPMPRYNKPHQFGTRRIPQRRFYGLDDQAVDEIAGGLADQHVYYILER